MSIWKKLFGGGSEPKPETLISGLDFNEPLKESRARVRSRPLIFGLRSPKKQILGSDIAGGKIKSTLKGVESSSTALSSYKCRFSLLQVSGFLPAPSIYEGGSP